MIRRWLAWSAVGVLIGLGLARVLLLVAVVRQRSMEPTLVEGDRLLVLRRWPQPWLRRGMIVVARESADGAELIVKRLVGLPGETIHQEPGDHAEEVRAPLAIPPGMVFLRGDNRALSRDSRFWGPVPCERIVGIAVGRLPRPRPPAGQPLK